MPARQSPASTWAALCAEGLAGGYQRYLDAFPDPPTYEQVKRPSGEPRDFIVWRKLFFGRCDPQLEAFFRKRCLDDIEAMFAERLFERCQHNPASKFPEDRGQALCIRNWLRMAAGEHISLEQLRLAADDYYESVSSEPVGTYDEISEYSVVRCALLYFLVGDRARVEMMLAKLPGRKIFHSNLIIFTRGILRQPPAPEHDIQKALLEILAVDFYSKPNYKGFVEADLNFLLLSVWACFKSGTTLDQTTSTLIEWARSLVR